MIANINRILLAISTVVFPHLGSAQTQEEPTLRQFLLITQRDSVSTQAQEDHPRCNGSGQHTYSISLKADNLRFTFEGDDWDGSVLQFTRPDSDQSTGICVVGMPGLFRGWPYDQPCNSNAEWDQVVKNGEQACPNVLTRRANQVSELAAECLSEENPPSLNSLIKAAHVDVDAAVSALICQGPAGIGVVESNWSVTLKMDNLLTTFEGQLGQTAETDGGPALSLRYDQGSRELRAIPNYAEGAVGPDPMTFGNYSLSLTFENLLLPGADNDFVRLDALSQLNIVME